MTDNSGQLPDPAVLYSQPLRGRLAAQGLQGATVASLVYGGLPTPWWMNEQLNEKPQVDVPAAGGVATGPTDKDRAYTPHPYLPSEQKLDYVHKLGSASLVTLALVVVVLFLVFRPARAVRALEGRAGGA